MSNSLKRKLANYFFSITDAFVSEGRREWWRAMSAEAEHINSDWKALEFALGCSIAIIWETMHMQKYEPLLRWGLGLAVFIWASAKLYVVSILLARQGISAHVLSPALTLGVFSISALAYGGLSFSLVRKKMGFAGIFILAALLANVVLFSATQFQFQANNFQSGPDLVWRFAIISEEYFIWTCTAMGAGFAMALRHSDLSKTMMRTW